MIWDHGGSNSYRMGAEDRYDLQLATSEQEPSVQTQQAEQTSSDVTNESNSDQSTQTLTTPRGAEGGVHLPLPPHLPNVLPPELGESEERDEYLDRVEARLRRLGMKFFMDTDEEDDDVRIESTYIRTYVGCTWYAYVHMR